VHRAVTVLASGLLAGLVLGACGSSGGSFSDGYSVGQAYAASLASFTSSASVPRTDCLAQWRVAAPANDARAPWLRGCEAGFRQIAKSMGQPIP